MFTINFYRNLHEFKKHLFDILICLFLALVQWRFIIEILTLPNFIESLRVSIGVFHGKPHWEIFQSRVLGPWTLYLLNIFIKDVGYCFGTLIFCGISISNFLFLWAIKPYTSNLNKFLFLVLYNFIFSIFIDDLWLISWDIFSLIFFTIFLGLVIRNSKLWNYLILYIFMLLNRESVHFLSIYLIFNPLVIFVTNSFKLKKINFSQLDIKTTITGILMFIFGIIFIYNLRNFLLIEEVGPKLFNLPDNADRAFQIHFIENVYYIFNNLKLSASGDSFAIVIIFLSMLTLLSISFFKLEFEKYFSYILINFLMLIAILVFAVINETRVYFELIPCTAFLLLKFLNRNN